jgi:hypothetical protein
MYSFTNFVPVMANAGPAVCMQGSLNFVQDISMKGIQVSEMVNPLRSLQSRSYKIHQSLTDLTHASNFLFCFDSGSDSNIPRALSLNVI